MKFACAVIVSFFIVFQLCSSENRGYEGKWQGGEYNYEREVHPSFNSINKDKGYYKSNEQESESSFYEPRGNGGWNSEQSKYKTFKYNKNDDSNSLKEVENYIFYGIDRLHQLFKDHFDTEGIKNMKTNNNELLKFEDPFRLPNYENNNKFNQFKLTNVQIYGLSSNGESQPQIQNDEVTTTLSVNVPELIVTGNYSAYSKFNTESSGAFHIKLGGISYNENFYYSHHKNGINLNNGYGKTEFKDQDVTFENIDKFSSAFQEWIVRTSITQVLEAVGQEISHKMRHLIVSRLMGRNYNGPSEKFGYVRNILQTVVAEGRNYVRLQRMTYLSQKYYSESLMDKDFTMRISEMKLYGLDSFTLLDKFNLYPENGKVEMETKIDMGPLNGVAFVQTNDADPSMKHENLAIRFNIEHAVADIGFSKDNNHNQNSPFKVKSVHVYSQVSIENQEQYEGHIENMVKYELPKTLKRMVDEKLSQVVRQSTEYMLREYQQRYGLDTYKTYNNY